ncbi:hypothetical protein [Olleya aquimaris]|uniref:Uncharacterized protein n=1 Tax=Olleya aquimaris TaxID=639310 RepID=A0A327RJ08_9FLAO|nr:hypothetical protein [Olleya aquimaris]RAJ16208.1 hypothetical protein LY08_01063 [Olleya aquimaris]
MNNLLKFSAFLCLIFIASSCTTESLDDSYNQSTTTPEVAQAYQSCSNQNPQSKLVNNGSVNFTFKIIDSNSNIIQEQDIIPGGSSSWLTFNDGETTFSIESASTGVSDSKVVLDMNTCTEVEIIVNSSNSVEVPIVQTVN